jgi:rod shape-determining protein MreC
MFKKPRYIVLILMVLLVLVVLNLPRQTATQLKLVVGGLFLPLFGLANSAHNLGGKVQNALTPRQSLIQELEQLRRENQLWRLQAMQGDEALRENVRLREMLGAAKQPGWNPKLGRVIGRDPANWWRTAQIDLGSRDGVRPYLTVITPEGLVGRISEVSLSRSQVVLVGDPNCKVTALVQETRDLGVIVPSATDSTDNSLVDLTYLPRNSTLKPGLLVVTSGDGTIFPAGIPIGRIVDVRNIDLGLRTEARVKLAVNFNRLEEVLVLIR